MQVGHPVALKRVVGSTLRTLVHATYDALDRGRRTADPLIPPRGINPNIAFTPRRAAYATEFVRSGDRVAEMLVAYADLQPSQSVLDIGCGIGRVARALTTRLSQDGQYRGFDVDPHAIAWCQQAYRAHSNFSFAHVPIGYINVRDKAPLRGEDLVFPYLDSSFDLVFSVSVYTHLSRVVTDHYLSETARVLRPGGACVNTFFVMDQFALDAMRAGRADRTYRDLGNGVYACDATNPNLGIGFGREVIRELHGAHALEVIDPVRFGPWSGRSVKSFVYQDVVVARKSTSHARRGSTTERS